MSKLLIEDLPLMVLPELAVAIGFNEATTIQQLYWVKQNPKMGKVIDGRKWVRMTYEEWRIGHFPFWSDATIQRNFENLEWMGLVESRDDLNQLSFDRTKWYCINLESLDAVEQTFQDTKRIVEHRNMIDGHSKLRNASPQSEGTIPESSSPENSPQKPKINNPPPPATANPNIFKLYENLGLSINPTIKELLLEAEHDFPADWIAEAFKRSAAANARNWNYISKILANWQTAGGMDASTKPKPAYVQRSGPPKSSALPKPALTHDQQLAEYHRLRAQMESS